MKRFFGLVFSLAIMLTCAASASAQDMPPGGPPQGGPPGGMRMQFQMPSFADLDKNKDKKLSRDEMPGQFPPQVFDRLDENKDGFVDEVEWGRMRTRFEGGPGGGMRGGPQVGERFVKFMDANHDGKISREEFAKVEQLFDNLDQDHNGDLSQEELNGFFRALNEAQTQATGGVDTNNLFTKFDKNKDGKLTAEEMSEERTFKALDLNKDGSVTREEADQALKQIADRSRAKKQSQPNPPNN